MSDNRQLAEGLGRIVNEVETVALDAASEQRITNQELAEILAFLTKVSHVVEQAFRDVVDILIDVKFWYIGIPYEHIQKVKKKIDLILARSHYRDAEEICSRLAYLRQYYESELARLIDPLPGRQGWSGLLGLIEEREGRILMLIHSVLCNIQEKLEPPAPGLPDLASSQLEIIKGELRVLNTFTNQILGLSGRPGLLELVRDNRSRATIVGEMSVLINQGMVDMAKTYIPLVRASFLGIML